MNELTASYQLTLTCEGNTSETGEPLLCLHHNVAIDESSSSSMRALYYCGMLYIGMLERGIFIYIYIYIYNANKSL